jgi:hypothetical protein
MKFIILAVRFEQTGWRRGQPLMRGSRAELNGHEGAELTRPSLAEQLEEAIGFGMHGIVLHVSLA